MGGARMKKIERNLGKEIKMRERKFHDKQDV